MNSFKFLLIFVISLIVNSYTSAQWSEIKIPFGYEVENSFVDSKGNIFARTSEDFYYFERSKQKWIKLIFNKEMNPWDKENEFKELQNHDILFKIDDELYIFNQSFKTWETYISPKYPLINVDDQGRVWCHDYEASNIGFRVSKNKGVSYQHIKIPLNLESCSFDLVFSYKDEYNLAIGCCGNNCHLYKFTDSGDFEELIDVDSYPSNLYVNPNTGTIFITKEYYLYRSTDGGNNFDTVKIKNNPWLFDPKFKLSAGILTFQDAWDLYYSEDDGMTWEKYNENVSYYTPFAYTPGSISMVNSKDTLISLTTDCGIQGNYLSADKGQTWTENNERLYIPNIYKLTEHNNIIYAFTCSDTSVLRSSDKGISWNNLVVHDNNFEYSIYDMGFSDGELYALTYSGLFVSADEGLNFTKVDIPENAFIDHNTYVLLISNSGNICLLSSSSQSYKSNDAGLTWSTFEYSQNSISNPKIDNEGNIWESIDQYGFQKYDNNKNQNETIEISQLAYIYSFAIANNGIFYFLAYDQIFNELDLYVSKDYLKSYKKVPLVDIPYGTDIFTDSDNNLYLNSQDAIYISIDEGESFELFVNKPSNINYYSMHVSSDDRLLAYETYSERKIYEFDTKLSAGSLVSGTLFKDENNDCISQVQELKVPGVLVNIEGPISKVKFSDKDGNFRFRANEGNYTVSVKSPNNLWEACPGSNITVLPNQSGSVNVDLGLITKTICPYLTLDIQTPIMRRCFDNYIYVKYCNEGTEASLNTQLKISLPSKMSYLSSSITPNSINGNELIYDLGELSIGECGQIVLKATLSCDAEIDELICIGSELTPKYSCANELPNLANINKCSKATGSLDPNDKTSFINGIPTNGKSDMNQDIDYLIRFQNTGTDTAFRVVVVDIIPKEFDITSLKVLNSSHPFSMQLSGERAIKFVFDPIMLPDSNINESASHGFIAFRISPLKDLSYGTYLINHADIFFDFNDPVTTNTDYVMVSEPTSSSEIKEQLQFSYYPNPTKEELTLQLIDFKSQTYTLRITDVLGKELLMQTWNGTNLNVKLKPTMLPGLYFVNIKDNEGRQGYGKFVIQQ